MELRRVAMALGAGALLAAVPACQRSDQQRAQDQRRDASQAQENVREERKELAEERRDQQQDAAQATQGEREDLAKAQQEASKEGAEAAQAGSAAAAASGSVNGRVIRSTDDELVVRPAGEERDLSLKVGSDTNVTVDGQRASMDQLREGAQVRASFSEKDGERHATTIELEKR